MGEIADALSRSREEPPSPQERASPTTPGPRRGEFDAGGAEPGGRGLRETGPDSRAGRGPEQPTESEGSDARCKIPRDPDGGSAALTCVLEPDGSAASRFRHCAVRLRATLDDRPKPSVLITSAVAGEGKTTVSVNLALALASIAPEFKIALVDLDFRRGRIAEVLGYRPECGIEDVLRREASLDEVRVRTDFEGLDFIPNDGPVPDPHGLLGSGAREFFEELHRRYDYLVCDGPPVCPVPDAPLLIQHVGGCLAVVASGRTRHADFTEMAELMPRPAMIGTFLNESRSLSSRDRYTYYAYRGEVDQSKGSKTEGSPDDGVRSPSEGGG